MKKYLIHPFLLSLFVVAIGCENNPDSKDRAEDANKERFDDRDTKKDAEFAVDAATIGMFEVQAGQLAASNATHPRVKEMGQMIAADHEKANRELKDLAARKNITLPTALSDDKRDKYNDLSEKTGNDFDKEFVDNMVDSHEKSIDKYEDIAENGNDQELRSWASGKIPSLQAHLREFKALQDQVKKNNNNTNTNTNTNTSSNTNRTN